ncbi:transglutaminaseTgpA domain-containing protein [Glaciecola sp. 2405UD65-10]|uniref:transglutaminase family protein n=1 Tax=Glaciecola sp. 2405UD65-10 TaxID=3397244 RepID=UPI003B5A3E7B
MQYRSVNKSTRASVYLPLLLVFVAVLLSMAQVLMSWVWVLSACAMVIALLRVTRKLPNIKSMTLNLLAIFCMVLLAFLSNEHGLMATMVNLLVVAGCLKLINMQNKRDFYLILAIQMFLIACGLVYHQTFAFVMTYFLLLVLLLISAFLVNRGDLKLSKSYQQSIKIIAQALPITVALFIVAPRLPPFWQTVVDKSAQTGLSESLTPGDIASLAKTDDLVFRAEFTGAVPPPEHRYWRSIVLDYFDGNTWSIASNVLPTNQIYSDRLESNSNNDEPNYHYLVMAEPNNTKWLFSLDIPNIEDNMGSDEIYVNGQYQLYTSAISNSPSLYILRSRYHAPLSNFTPIIDNERYLQLPQDSNPRTDTWVEMNVVPKKTFEGKLNVINSLFDKQIFKYTLHPPLMRNKPIDAFLFDHQKGFCSHYASALTYILRKANIPARMVAGYQGGELQSDNMLSVRQYDAHAWVEAYHPDKGWLRYDPTALIAPNRALSGLMSSLSEHETHYYNDTFSSIFPDSFLSRMRKNLAVIDFNWNTFVLEFGQDSQASLIERIFGELNQKNLTSFLIATFAAIALFLALLFVPYKKWFSYKPRSDLDKVLRKLDKLGFSRKNSEPLYSFYQRIESQLPSDLKMVLAQYISIFYRHHYQAAPSINASSAKIRKDLHSISRKLLNIKVKPNSGIK